MPLDALTRRLASAGVSPDEPLLIACSGGRDSQVLMHAAAALRRATPVTVAHVHHGLQQAADAWLDFCAAEAMQLGLPFLHRRLSPPLQPGRPHPGGLEAWAREWRYRALAEMATEAGATVVLTAHHAHDQLETVEIRRRRGTGVLGLAGMRAISPLPHAPAGMRLLRPFLELPREALAQWARDRRIGWVDDPSNADARFTRNRVRHHLVTQLSTGQQSMPAELQAIGLFQQAADRIQRQAADDVTACSLQIAAPEPGQPASPGTAPSASGLPVLSRAALRRLDAARRAEALRYWLGLAGCRMPSRLKLIELERQLVLADAAQAILRHDGIGFLRYRDRIGLMPGVAAIQPLLLRWQGEGCIELSSGHLQVDTADGDEPGALEAEWLRQHTLLIDQGRGRDRWRPRPGAPSRSWKNLMQERGVPPCLRASLPVLRLGGQLLFAAPFGTSAPDRVAAPVAAAAASEAAAGESAPASRFTPGASTGFVCLRWVPSTEIQPWV